MAPPVRYALVPVEAAGRRFDQVLARLLPEHSRSRLAAWIKSGAVLLDGEIVAPRHAVRGGESVELRAVEETMVEAAPEPIALNLVYEDTDLLVIDKPAGLVVHPGAGNPRGTLLNALLHHDPHQANIPRAGIVHRLDKDTSGLLVVARTDAAHAALVRRADTTTAATANLGLGLGRPQPPVGLIDAPLGRDLHDRKRQAVLATGRAARTRYTSERVYPPARGVEATTLLRLRLETGRTHQIRVHLAYIGHPIVGDAVYGARAGRTARALGIERQFLHATRLAFDLPASGARVTFSSPLPDDLQAALARLAAAAPAEET